MQQPSPAPSLTDPPLWDEDERRAWAPPEQLNSAEWAEKYRELSKRQSSRPGPWRNANQPALVGLMLLATIPSVREIWVLKSAQFGASEGVRNILGHRAHLDPVPAMLVLPDEKSGRKIVRKRVIPLFEDTAVLRKLLTGSTRDKKLTSILLSNGFELSLAWAGSPSAMASDPYALVVLDEVDKYASAGLQADPVAEARVRLRTYGEAAGGISLLIALSTPSTPLGPIAIGYEDCSIKLHFYIACPHCGTLQRLTFDKVRWEKFTDLPDAKARAARIKGRRAAWLECENPLCAQHHPEANGRITEKQRRTALNTGFWATEDQSWRLHTDGRIEGKMPEGDQTGIHIHAQLDLSVTLAEIAAEFVKCDGRKEQLKDFYNLWQGEPFKDTTVSTTASLFAAKCKPNDETGFEPPPARRIPPWASRLLLTVDSQKDYFWFALRAWGQNFRSQRVHHGRAGSFEEIEAIYYDTLWHYEGELYPPLRCAGSSPLFIDSGGGMDREEQESSITDRVYRWCLRDPIWRLPIKGNSKPFDEHIRWRDVTYQPPGEKTPYVVRLHFLDPIYWRDLLSSYIVGTLQVPNPATGEVFAVDQWLLNDDNDERDYNRHLAAVQKTRIKKGRSIVQVYATKTIGARHDFHDLEAYQIALAHGPGRCFALPTAEHLARQSSPAPPSSGKPAGVRMPDGRKFLATQR